MPVSEREAMGARGHAYFKANFDPERLADDLMRHLVDAVGARQGAIT
jgi:hypothetical protein